MTRRYAGGVTWKGRPKGRGFGSDLHDSDPKHVPSLPRRRRCGSGGRLARPGWNGHPPTHTHTFHTHHTAGRRTPGLGRPSRPQAPGRAGDPARNFSRPGQSGPYRAGSDRDMTRRAGPGRAGPGRAVQPEVESGDVAGAEGGAVGEGVVGGGEGAREGRPLALRARSGSIRVISGLRAPAGAAPSRPFRF